MFLWLHISVCFWLKKEQGLFIQWALLGYSFQFSVYKWVIHGWCFPLLSEVKQGSQSFNYYSSTLIMKFQAFFRKKPGFPLGGLCCVCTTVSQLEFKCLFSWFSEVCDPSFPASQVNPTSKVSVRHSSTRHLYSADHQQRLCVATFGKWVGERLSYETLCKYSSWLKTVVGFCSYKSYLERLPALHPSSGLCWTSAILFKLPHHPPPSTNTHTFTFILSHLQTDSPRSSDTYPSLFPPPQQLIMIYCVFTLNSTLACTGLSDMIQEKSALKAVGGL